jgi:hypothetical protein
VKSPQGVALFWLGVVGVAQFGGLWLAAKWLDAGRIQQVSRDRLDGIISYKIQRRLGRWIHFVPLLTVLMFVSCHEGRGTDDHC